MRCVAGSTWKKKGNTGQELIPGGCSGSEIVVYTTLAVVFSRHDDATSAGESDGDNSPTLTGGGVLWRPIADGAWTQLHLFLEMERDVTTTTTTCSSTGATMTSPRHQLMRNFRLVAWVLETGKVIVNDVVCARCMWAPIDELLWQFTSADGHCYGFRFHSVEQADECAQVVCGILNNVDEIRRLVKKMFQTRTTTREFLALLYDIGFFKLDSSRRSTMIESAHAAVASLQTQPEFPRSRRGMHSVYPKETIPDASPVATSPSARTASPRARRSSGRAAPAAADDAVSTGAGIIKRSTEKRRSSHHLLAQFSAVQLAALAATEMARSFEGTETVAEDPECSSSDSGSNSDYDSDSESNGDHDSTHNTSTNDDDDGNTTNFVPTRDDFVSRSTTRDVSEISAASSADGVRASVQAKGCISMPYKTRQELHVTYNHEFSRYEGLPWAWRRLNHQFGLPLEAVPKRHVPGYTKKIPAVLQMLKESLIANQGYLVEGIFRVAPDKDKCAAVKQAINDGTYTGCNDVHIIANLIKVWFRELPQSLFNTIPEKHIYRTCELKDPDAILASLDVFAPVYESVVKWLLDLMADVATHDKQNKMTARNMAIVISPNLFSIESDNPMYALTMSQKVAEFTFVLLDARLRHGNR